MSDDIWRLYVRDWVTVHTEALAATNALPCMLKAQEWVKENLDGRIPETDIRYTMNTDTIDFFWCHVEVRKDNLKGEFKHAELAETWARRNGYDEITVVERNSKADHQIRSYGVNKL